LTAFPFASIGGFSDAPGLDFALRTYLAFLDGVRRGCQVALVNPTDNVNGLRKILHFLHTLIAGSQDLLIPVWPKRPMISVN